MRCFHSWCTGFPPSASKTVALTGWLKVAHDLSRPGHLRQVEVMKLALTIAATLVIGVALPSAAHAADGDNVPAAADAKAWSKYVTDTNKQNAAQDWSTPQGTLIADSGFRPFADGFSFFNTGLPDSANHQIFGSPLRPTDLNAAALRSLMGKRV